MSSIFLAIASFFFFVFTAPTFHASRKSDPIIDNQLRLVWKVNTGVACFRTRPLVHGGELIMGSNGMNYMDYNLFDKKSGIYVMDAATGTIRSHFGNEVLGDMDVNGVLFYKNRIYYGNDNEEFICSSPEGKIIWRNPASGDIEHEPILLDMQGNKYVVYASEAGEVRAVDPETGKTKWVHYTSDFSGWKPGQNRNIFKVKAWFSNTTSFFTRPVLADLNRDGINDLIYLTYDSRVYAINGKSGSLLWSYMPEHGLGYLLIRTGTSSEPSFLISSSFYDSTYKNALIQLDRSGKAKTVFETADFEGPYFGLSSLSSGENEYMVPVLHAVMHISNNGDSLYFIPRDSQYLGDPREVHQSQESYYRREPLIGDKIFRFGNQARCMLVLDQFDNWNDYQATVQIISINDHKKLVEFHLPSSSEMAPLITDVNGDGTQEVIFNCRDGYTYCYELRQR